MAITYLRPLTVPKSMQADRVEGFTVKNAHQLGHSSTIVVQRENPDGSMTRAGTVEVDGPAAINNSGEMPVDAGKPMAAPDFVDKLLTQAERIVDSTPEVTVRTEVASTILQGQPIAPGKAYVPPTVTTPPVYTQPVAPVVRPKKRVRLSNRGMGKVTVSVRAVSISETCVILAYPKDADNIVEPPLCGSDTPIKVEFEAKSYSCVFGGWTADLEDMYLVILIRIEEEPEKSATA